MKKYSALLLIIILAFAMATPGFAAGYVMPEESPVTAQSAYFINLDTGAVMLDFNSDEQRDIASLTKLMTALLLIENIDDLEGTVITSPSSIYVPPITYSSSSTADIYPNEEVTALSLLYGILLPSGNEAAQIAAYYLGGESSENFYVMMNERAAQLGCTNTNFTNPHGLDGLDDGNYSSAKDLALIAQKCWEYDIFREVVGTESYNMPFTNIHTYAQNPDYPDTAYTIYNTNSMLRETNTTVYRDYIKGMKTGATTAAGRTFASVAVNDKGETYIGIVLGSPYSNAPDGYAYSFHDTAFIYDWMFDNFSVQQPVQKTQAIAEVAVALSSQTDTLALMPAQDFATVLPSEGSEYADQLDVQIQEIEQAIREARQQATEDGIDLDSEENAEIEAQINPILPDTLMYEFDIPEQVNAPIKQGDVIGSFTISMNGELLDTIDLVASQDVNRNFLLFIVDWVGGFFESLYFRVVIGLTVLYILVLIVIIKLMQVKYISGAPRKKGKKKKKKNTKNANNTNQSETFTQDEWDKVSIQKQSEEDWTNLVEVDRLPPKARKTFFKSKQKQGEKDKNKKDK